MKHILITIMLIQGCIGCAQDSLINYDNALLKIEKQRVLINAKKGAALRANHSSQALYKTLTKEVFPAWYGTEWDYNGISNKPGKGQIACGYFVSTTLKHVGFNLNRYKTAQQAASVIIHEICGKKSVKKYRKSDVMIQYLEKQKDGIYVLGLDYHVGFLVVEKGKVYFVHSDYFNGKVVRELATESTAFSSSTYFVIGNITYNNSLMSNWLKNTRIYG